MTYDSGDYAGALDARADARRLGRASRRGAREARRAAASAASGSPTTSRSQSGAPRERAEVTVLPRRRGRGRDRHAVGGPGPRDQLRPAGRRNGSASPTDRVTHRAPATPTASRSAAARIPAARCGSPATTIAQASQRHHRQGHARSPRMLLEASDADIAFADGRFTREGHRPRVGLFELRRATSDRPRSARPLARRRRQPRRRRYPYGWHVCEVEIDPETGVVRIDRYTAIDDVGRAVNPMILHGQTHGGIAQGVGQALMEHCIYDPRAASSWPARSWTTPCRAPTICRRSSRHSARCRRPPIRSASAAAARAASRRRSA